MTQTVQLSLIKLLTLLWCIGTVSRHELKHSCIWTFSQIKRIFTFRKSLKHVFPAAPHVDKNVQRKWVFTQKALLKHYYFSTLTCLTKNCTKHYFFIEVKCISNSYINASSVPRLFITYMYIIMYVMNCLGTEDDINGNGGTFEEKRSKSRI